MPKKPNRRAKKTVFLIWMACFFTTACLAAHTLYPYIGINLISNIFPFLTSTANNTPPFYGENIDMSQILPSSQHYVVNSKGQDLIDIAAELGINIVRITNDQRSYNNKTDSVYTRDQWDQVLSKMQSKGIKAIILIETVSNKADYYKPDIRPVYLHVVQEYIDSGVFSNPDIYAVDIKNEPVLTSANIKMLQRAHDMIKVKYHDLKQTIGWWATPKSPEDPYKPNNYNWSDFSAGQKIAGIVDFYSIHLYDLARDNSEINLSPALKTKVFISQVENGLQTTKSILIEEFGEANGDAVSDGDTIGSPQLQANVYHGVYEALKEIHSGQLIGTIAFDFYSRNQFPDAWAIVKKNGNYLFPAAYILQEYALGRNTPSLQSLTVVNSESYLMTNTDNYSVNNLYIHDRIGLKIQLDRSKFYIISLSAADILLPVELFHYERLSNSYYAVYQATRKGSVHLSIVSQDNCSTSDICTVTAYSLTINIQ